MADRGTAREVVRRWPSGSRQAALDAIRTYGEPDVVRRERLLWRNVDSWQRIIARRRGRHSEPAPLILRPSRH